MCQKKIFCRVPALALGKEVLCRVLGSDTRQRRELYRVQGLGTRQRPSLPSARAGTRQKIFCFFAPLFFCSLNILFKTPCSNLAQFWLFLLYFVSFFVSLNFMEYFKFELQVHGIIEFGRSKNDIHDIWCMLRPYPGTHMKFRASCWRNMTRYLREKCI